MVGATVSCAAVWELAFLLTRGSDSHVAGFLVVMATLTYFVLMALAGRRSGDIRGPGRAVSSRAASR